MSGQDGWEALGLGNEHVFVIGCERSGTTPLVRLLGAHPNIALGMERYKFILREMRTQRSPELLTPAHFERDRFLDFRPTDTNLVPPRFAEFYARIEQRFDAGTITWAGDKVLPPDTFTTLALANHFPGARFVFTFRDLLRVASSFDVRAQDPEDPDWPARNDHEIAYRHWVEALDATDALVAKVGVERVFLVRPRRLYQRNGEMYRAMFAFLGLDTDPSVDAQFEGLCAKWHGRQEKPLVLDEPTQRSLLARIDQAQLRRYHDRAEDQLVAADAGDRRHRRAHARKVADFESAAIAHAAEVAERRRQTRHRTKALARTAARDDERTTGAVRPS